MSYGDNAVLETVEQIITQIITIPKGPPPCNCKKRVLAMACHAIKQRSRDLPALCQEFQKKIKAVCNS